MDSRIQKLIDLAKAEVGYHEGKNSGVWNNNQKYSPAVPGLEWSQNQAWCATFQSWLAMKAGLADYFPRTASTDTAAQWFKARKQWSETPVVGGWGFLGTNGDMHHVFLVVAFDANYVYTVEGNTNNNGSAQGDGVYTLKRLRKQTSIEGYGFPKLPVEGKPAKPVKKTSRGVQVDKALAALKKANTKGNPREGLLKSAIAKLEKVPFIK